MKKYKGLTFDSVLNCGHYPDPNAGVDISLCVGYSETGFSMCLDCCEAYDRDYLLTHDATTLYIKRAPAYNNVYLYTTGERITFEVIDVRETTQNGLNGSIITLVNGRFRNIDGSIWAFGQRGNCDTARCVRLRKQPKDYCANYRGYQIKRNAGEFGYTLRPHGGPMVHVASDLASAKSYIEIHNALIGEPDNAVA